MGEKLPGNIYQIHDIDGSRKQTSSSEYISCCTVPFAIFPIHTAVHISFWIRDKALSRNKELMIYSTVSVY